MDDNLQLRSLTYIKKSKEPKTDPQLKPPNDLILYINPSCQTLSKALEMSKKILQTSKGEP